MYIHTVYVHASTWNKNTYRYLPLRKCQKPNKNLLEVDERSNWTSFKLPLLLNKMNHLRLYADCGCGDIKCYYFPHFQTDSRLKSGMRCIHTYIHTEGERLSLSLCMYRVFTQKYTYIKYVSKQHRCLPTLEGM
jgi:hypothetical protein